MPPVNVLFPYVGGSVGGSHVSSLLLAQMLPPERYRPVVAVHEDGPLNAYLDSLGVEALRAPRVPYADRGGALARGLRRMEASGPLRRFLDRHRIGVVHTNDMRIHMTWGAAARKANAVHVWHQRTPVRAEKHGRAAVRAGALLAVSEYCVASFPPAMQATAQVVYNPFKIAPLPDKAAARAQLRTMLGVGPATRCLIFVGNFAPRKRPVDFVALAAALVAGSSADMHFVMLGDSRGSEGDAVRAAISAAGLDGRFHLPGLCYPVDSWLAGADLLVAPAIEEAFGRTLVEAQLQATPVLASDAGGHREIVRHLETGVLVAPGDIDHFAREATALLTDAHRAERLALAGRQDAETRFSVARHLETMLTLYDGLTGQG